MGRAWQVAGGFGRENLSLVTVPQQAPGAGEVRLRMQAVSLNFRDHLMVAGAYNPRQPLPLVPCSDGVGIVEAVGEGVTDVSLGDRVCPVFCQGWLSGPIPANNVTTSLGGPLPGTLREEMIVPAAGVVHVPSHLTDAEAACLPCAAVTAWHALEDVSEGDWVLTQGTGGVSLFALQLAQLKGARVLVTSSSDERLARAAALGATHGLNYKTTPGWGKAAKALVPTGFDCVVELGGADTLDQSLRAVRAGGRIALIGVLGGVRAEVLLTRILMHGVRVQGIFVGSRDHLVSLADALSAHPEVRPVVDRVVSFDEAPQAFDQLALGGHFGKVVISLS